MNDRVEKHVDLVAERSDLLTLLEGRRLSTGTVVEESDASRATVTRALGDLSEAGLVERDGGAGTYGLTAAGRLALEHHRRHRRQRADLLAATDLLSALPATTALDLDAVVGGEVVVGAGAAPYRPTQALCEAVQGADRYRAVLPALGSPRHLRTLYEHVVRDGDDATLVVSDPLWESLSEQFPRRLAAMADAGGAFDVLVGDTPDVGVVTVERDGETTALVVVPGEESGVRGLVRNDDNRAVAWAERIVDRRRAAATERTDSLRQPSDGGVLAGDTGEDPRLLVSLERQGFVRVTREHLADRRVADPTTAWRAGLDLAEVHAGYAVDRTTDDGTPLTERLVSGLAEGDDHLLVGPPGAGKSTTAKQVACEWRDREFGPVLYREGGRGAAVDASAVDDLVATLEATAGHALVVVEDAVRPGAAAVFDAVERLADSDDVSFLLDARVSEWQDPGRDVDTDAADLRVVRMPRLDDRDRERLVEHVRRTVDDADLQGGLAETAASGDGDGDGDGDGGPAPGGVLLLLHRLALRADPLTDAPTGLEADAADACETLAEAGTVALDVGTVVNLLNAAGRPVAPAHLRAVATDDLDDVVDRLSGRMLFGRENGRYRTVHEAWSVAFLDALLDREGADARDRVGRVLSALLALATDPQGDVDVDTADNGGRVDQIVEDPGGWADRTLEAVYALGRERPKLASLLGDAEGPVVEPPAVCESVSSVDTARWLGRALADAGDLDAAETVFDRLPEAGEVAVDRHLWLAETHRRRGEYDPAEEHASAGLALAEERDAGDATVARARSRLGDVFTDRGEFERARERLQDALSAAREAGDRRATCEILRSLGRVVTHQGEYDRAEECFQESREIARDLGDARRAAKALGNLGGVARLQGDYERARECHERSLELKRRVGDRRSAAKTLINLANFVRRDDEYDRAREHLERSLEIARDIDDRGRVAVALRVLGNLALDRSEPERAREHLQEALEVARDIGDRHEAGVVLLNLGRAARDCGDVERGRDRLERSAETLAEVGDERGVAVAQEMLGGIAHDDDDHDAAREHLERALDRLDGVDVPLTDRLDVRERLVAVERDAGNPQAAREHRDRALERIGAAEDPPPDARERFEGLVGDDGDVGAVD